LRKFNLFNQILLDLLYVSNTFHDNLLYNIKINMYQIV